MSSLKKNKKLIQSVAQKVLPEKINQFLSKKFSYHNEPPISADKQHTLNSDLLNHHAHQKMTRIFDEKFLRQISKLEHEGLSNLDIYKKLPSFSMDLGEKLWHYSHQLIHQDKQALDSQLLDKIFIQEKELNHEREQTEQLLTQEKKRNLKLFSSFPIMSCITLACVGLLPHMIDNFLAHMLIGCWGTFFIFLTYLFYRETKVSEEQIVNAQSKLNLLKSVSHEEALNLVNMIKQDDFAKLYHHKIVDEKRTFSTLEYQLLQHLHLIQNKDVHHVLNQKVEDKKKYLSKGL
jgi:hypothetical protein